MLIGEKRKKLKHNGINIVGCVPTTYKVEYDKIVEGCDILLKYLWG